MIKTINRKKYRVYAFDFETHNDKESIALNTSGVWLGVLLDEKSQVKDESCYFYSISEFIDRLNEMTSLKRHSSKDEKPCNSLMLYDYNLSFEWSFILPELLRRGYEWEGDGACSYSTISTHSCSSVWQIKLILENGQEVVMRDLAKIYGGGLGNVAKSMGLKTQKGEIDYTKNRLHNYVVPFFEKEYCFKDAFIIVEILKKQQDDWFFWSSISISSYATKKMIDFGYSRYKRKMLQFRKEYPKPEADEYSFLLKTKAGGITYAPKKYQFAIVNNVKHIDAHQMHPYQAYSRMFPYGEGTYGKGEPNPRDLVTHIYACHVLVSYTDVKLHSVIKLIGTDAIENAELWVWSFEIPTMKKCYVDLKIEYIDYYEYETKLLPWRKFYLNNFNDRLKAKSKGDNYNVMRFKKLNNASYGKLLEKAHAIDFENIIGVDGIITSVSHENGKDEMLGAKYTCLQVGSCIPAYSRVYLIETALKFGWQNIVYFDTDSIFYVDNEQTRNACSKLNHNYEMGAWELRTILKHFKSPLRKDIKCY